MATVLVYSPQRPEVAMSKSTTIAAVAVLSLIALFALRADRGTAAQVAPAKVQNWEYETILLQNVDVQGAAPEDLNKKGRQEWELCGTVTFDKSTVLIVKRPLRQPK